MLILATSLVVKALPTRLAGWHGERGDRVVEGAARQHESNQKLFERALETGKTGEELGIYVSDAMWALSHVRISTGSGKCRPLTNNTTGTTSG